MPVVEVEANLRPSVSRPVCLGVKRPSGTCNPLFFLLEISFRQLHVCYFVAPSLTRGRVCNLLYNCFWALPEQSLLGRSPAELTTIFYNSIGKNRLTMCPLECILYERNKTLHCQLRSIRQGAASCSARKFCSYRPIDKTFLPRGSTKEHLSHGYVWQIKRRLV
jgi:hypothetical protein